jgi:hypothetical protein
LKVQSKVLINCALVVVGAGGLFGGGVVWVVVWVVVVMAVCVILFFSNVWVGKVLMGLFRMLMLTRSCSSWLSSSVQLCSASSAACIASATCYCAGASRTSCGVLRLRVPTSRVPSSSS